MSDQVSGRYQGLNPFYNAWGQLANVKQSDIPVRSNLEIHGGGGLTEGILVTGKMLLALIPVTWGDEYGTVNVPIAGKEGEAASETFVAVFTGVANGKTSTLIQQGTSATAVVVKEKLFSQNLKESFLATPTNAPAGFVYAGICSTATTLPEVAAWKIKPKAIPYTTNGGVWSNLIASKAATEAAASFTVAGTELVPLVGLT